MNTPARCWHLLSNRWNSAITEYALSAVRSLSLAGVENLFTPLSGSPAETRACKYGLNVRSFPSFNLSAVPACRRIIRDFSPETVIVYGGPESFLAHFMQEPRSVIRFRGSEISGHPMSRLQQRLSQFHIDKFIVPGTSLLGSAEKIFGAQRVESIILGCETNTFRHQPVSRNPGRPQLLIFGRFDPVKGHREFLEIYRKMLDTWPPECSRPMLVIAGEPANVTAGMISEVASRLGITDEHLAVKTGRFEDVSLMMANASLGVVSSLGSEHICRVAEEFLLCGTAVAVSGAGSLEDVLFDQAGVSYRNRSPGEAAELLNQITIKTFRESEAERKTRADRARALFSLEKMGSALIAAASIST